MKKNAPTIHNRQFGQLALCWNPPIFNRKYRYVRSGSFNGTYKIDQSMQITQIFWYPKRYAYFLAEKWR